MNFDTRHGSRDPIRHPTGQPSTRVPARYVVATPEPPPRPVLPAAVAEVLALIAPRPHAIPTPGVESVPDEDVLDLLAPVAGIAPRSRIERKEERLPSSWIAIAYLPDGTEVPCAMRDVSKSGARIGVPDDMALPPRFALRIMGVEVVCQVRLCWRRDNQAGLAIERLVRARKAQAAR